jgi:alpha/beta superfamily hydrolase
MSTNREISIPCGVLSLEGALEIPDGVNGPAPGSVICHPHPLYGGNMHNNVVRAVKKGLLNKGFACVRFNFRGTGGSWGTHGNGIDEEEDVLAAMDFVQQQKEIDAGKLVLAGYSFGCWVGLKAAVRDSRPGILIGISPPVDSYDFEFLKQEERPKLLIAGDRDFVCSEKRFRELLDQIPQPKVGIILPGVDHFHGGNEETLTREVESFLDKFPLT